MTLAKLFNFINGAFYTLFGLYWAFQPTKIADAFGWEAPGQLGMHELRAYGMFFFGFGMLILGFVMRRVDQRPGVLALIFITLCFFSGRLLGIALDGPGPMLTYYEMGLEVFVVTFGLIAYRLSAPKTLVQ